MRSDFYFNVKKNLRQINKAIQMREIYFIIIFFLIKGFIIPSFEDFTYYFLMDEIYVSKFVFALLVLVA